MLAIDCTQIYFRSKVAVPAIKEVVVRNIGSSAIYYDWVKLQKDKLHAVSFQDDLPKFYNHHEPNVITPGQEITFEFLFNSPFAGVFI
jgi:hypothetical protein